MSAKLAICLWFDGNAEEAAQAYSSCIPGCEILRVHNSIEANGQSGACVAAIDIDLMGVSCTLQNVENRPPLSDALSLQIITANQEETDRVWNGLSNSGRHQEIGGTLTDNWGVTWQIIPQIADNAFKHGNLSEQQRVFAALMSTDKPDVATIEAALRDRAA